MYGALDISTSGLIAQRTRLESITANIANKDTFLDPTGQRNEPFQRRAVFFAPGNPEATTEAGRKLGVHVAAIEEEAGFQPRYEPGNPYADANGYVKYPAINTAFEQVNSYQALRAYEANIASAEATKSMVAQALRLLG
jgi:flagellar basal-body rod protein FlgC